MRDEAFVTALTGRFDAQEELLRRVALRMTGTPAGAEEALATARAELVRDGGASVRVWLTALVGQECVRLLQERQAGGRFARPGAAAGDRNGTAAGGRAGAADRGRGGAASGAADEGRAWAADGAADGGADGGGVEDVWLALFFVLRSSGAVERLAYVLHDVFGLPPHETARITGGSAEEAARLARDRKSVV